MPKILIIEDEKLLVSAYEHAFTQAGYDIMVAYNGEEALKLLSTYHPDIILLDWLMPVKNGFQTLTQIKQTPALATIPVIIASNSGNNEAIEQGLGLGAADYVIKSNLNLDTIVAKVNQHLL